MTDHQRRILLRLRDSLETFTRGGVSLPAVQLDLDANLGVVESKELKDEIAAASNQLDECMHIYEEQEGQELAQKVIAELIVKITLHCGFQDQRLTGEQ